MSIVVLHYHLFKNAGTSVDEMLKANFGEQWAQIEFEDVPAPRRSAALEAFLAGMPLLRALSSHTANLPVPALAGRQIVPIVMLRHPIDRIRSAYIFERNQKADTHGAQLAKSHDFSGYVRSLLDHPTNRQARDFQTYRLAFGTPAGETELDRAMTTLHGLSFVGLVEAYEQSLARLAALVQPSMPEFRPIAVRRNFGPEEASHLEQRLDQIAQTLGDELTSALWAANSDDLALFETVKKIYFAQDTPRPAASP